MKIVQHVDDAKELIGQVWERDGKQREITRIENLYPDHRGELVFGDVYWKRPGRKERKVPQWLPYFDEWLSKAELIEEKKI